MHAQVLGPRGLPCRGQVGRRRVQRARQRADAAGHHGVGQRVLGTRGTHRDVDAIARKIEHLIAYDEFDAQARMPRMQPAEAGYELMLRQHGAGRDPHQPADLGRVAGEFAFELVERFEHALAVNLEGLPLGSERQPVRRAVDEPRAAGIFDARQCA
ncbi:hypothetical protein D9M68_763840 [compost metagenome]